jgi:hypothetical protein
VRIASTSRPNTMSETAERRIGAVSMPRSVRFGHLQVNWLDQ